MSALGLGDVREHTLFPTLVVSSHGKRVLLASHFWPPVVLEGEHSPAPLSSFFTAKSHPQDCMFLSVLNSKGSASTMGYWWFHRHNPDLSVWHRKLETLRSKIENSGKPNAQQEKEASVPGREDSCMLLWCLPDIDHVGFLLWFCFYDNFWSWVCFQGLNSREEL